jgi:hypothetical protein
LKSKARVFGTEVRINLLVATTAADKATAEARLRAIVDDLIAALEPHGIVLIPQPSEKER